MVDTITQRARDFTNRDFDSWVLELRARATAAVPQWTDFNKSNFGNILLELFAHTLDVFSFTQDQQFIETRITWARLRRSMIHLGRNVGFTLPGATIATVDLELTITDGLPRAFDIVVPKGTVVRTSDQTDDVEFDLTADATITAGLTQISTASAENAREQTDPIVTDGSPNQSFLLSSIPYVDASAVVTVGVTTFTEVDSFLQSGSTDDHFVVDVDENDRATVKFGDGINGAIPTGAGTVVYKTGGGSSGNVDANTLDQFRDGNRFPDVSGDEAQLTVRNPSAVSGAVDRMSVEEARVAIPESLTTVGKRSVTRLDFEVNARKVRGVARSMMLTSDDDGSIPENEGRLFIVPVGGGLPSSQLKTDVLDFILAEFPPTITFTFSVEDPVLLIVSISATVFLNQGVTETAARTAIEDAYDSFFALVNADGSPNTQIDFGFKIRNEIMPPGSTQGELPFSDLFEVITNAPLATGALALRKVDEDVFTPVDDVLLLDTQFPIVGSISLLNGDTSSPF